MPIKRIVSSYLVACAAVAVFLWVVPFLVSVLSLIGTTPPGTSGPDLNSLMGLLLFVCITFVMTVVLTIAPSVVFIAAAEHYAIRAWWAYVLGGAGIGAVASSLMLFMIGSTNSDAQTYFVAALAFAFLGVFCGYIYWRLAVYRRPLAGF